jgi:hypothetical protein
MEVDDGTTESGTIDVYAEEVSGIGRDAQQDRGLAAGRWAGPDFDDQLITAKPLDDIGHRRPGQPCGTGDISPTDRSVLIYCPQHELLIGAPGLTMGRLGECGVGHGPHFVNGLDQVRVPRFVKTVDKVS